MSKDTSTISSIWDDFAEKIESLREALNTPLDEPSPPDKSSEEPNLLSQNEDKVLTDSDISDNEEIETEEDTPSNLTEVYTENVEETDTSDETDREDLTKSVNQFKKLEESDKLDYRQKPYDIKEESDGVDETDLEDSTDSTNRVKKIEEFDKFSYTQKIQDTREEFGNVDEPEVEDKIVPINQVQQTESSDEFDYRQEIQEPEIEESTPISIKSEKIDNHWIETNAPNPYIQKVDESREELNRSLEKARQLVNQQSTDTPKHEKKRFQFSFTRGDKRESNESNTVKEPEKKKKKNNELKPMVYEILETNQSIQDAQVTQNVQDNHDKGIKKPAKQSNDRTQSNQEKEIVIHRIRLEKSRNLGIPVFVKKPVNLEQVRELKSILTNQSNLKVLVDTGSSQGRVLVISGQDQNTLLNTLGQLPIVKSTTIESETINLVFNNPD